MLTEQDFAAWVVRAGLSEAAQATIAHIRSSGPSRRVGGGRSNVTGRYPSKKMGVTIQFESHRVELPAIFELEHDCSVLEYYDQVPAIKLDYRSADGKRLGVMHTPDFFVISEDRAGWEECKTEEELPRLSERRPNRYRRDGREWTCPQADSMPNPLACTTACGLPPRSTGCSSETFSFSKTICERRSQCRPSKDSGY
jgi:hypothetical protein